MRWLPKLFYFYVVFYSVYFPSMGLLGCIDTALVFAGG